MDTSFFIDIEGKNYSLEVQHLTHGYFKQFSPRIHVRPAYRITLVSNGSNMAYFQDLPPMHLGKNSLIFTNPLVRHRFQADPRTGVEHNSFIWRFKYETGGYALFPLQSLWGVSKEDSEPFVVRKLGELDAENFILKQREAERALASNNNFILAMCLWQLCFLGSSLIWPDILLQQPRDLDSSSKIISEVKKIISADISDSSLDLSKIGNHLKKHPNYINSVFKLSEGIPIGNYIRNKRLELAKTLLINTEYSISEIAELCGFNQHSYFTRTFNKSFKMNPLEYRNKYSSK